MCRPIAIGALAVFMAVGGLVCGIAIMAARGHQAGRVAATPRQQTPSWDTHDPGQLDSDWQKLQGAWNVVAVETDGEKVGGEQLQEFPQSILFEGNVATSIGGIMQSTAWVFRINPRKSPPMIDMVGVEGEHRGRILEGIYEIHGDTLKLCQSHIRRPTVFESQSGSGSTLTILERVAETVAR